MKHDNTGYLQMKVVVNNFLRLIAVATLQKPHQQDVLLKAPDKTCLAKYMTVRTLHKSNTNWDPTQMTPEQKTYYNTEKKQSLQKHTATQKHQKIV